MNERRIGKFMIDRKLIFTMTPKQANKIFKDMVIVRAEMMIAQDWIEYVAFGDMFDEGCEYSGEVPLYKAITELKKKKNGVEYIFVKWERVNEET